MPVTERGTKARNVIERLELPEPRPLTAAEKTLRFPNNLADVDAHQLGELMTHYAAMQNYADNQAKILWVDIVALDDQVEYVTEEKLAGTLPGVSATVSDRKARIRSLPHVRKLITDAADLRAGYERIVTLRDTYERYYQAASREVTRRVGTYSMES